MQNRTFWKVSVYHCTFKATVLVVLSSDCYVILREVRKILRGELFLNRPTTCCSMGKYITSSNSPSIISRCMNALSVGLHCCHWNYGKLWLAVRKTHQAQPCVINKVSLDNLRSGVNIIHLRNVTTVKPSTLISKIAKGFISCVW